MAAMSSRPVPNHQQLAIEMTQKMLEELNDLRAADRAREESEVKVPPGYAGHRGQGFPIEVILQHGSLASRCPGSATMWSLAQSAFVDEDDDEPLFLGFFLISGQRLRFHCAMARSSRSRARPVGRWQLQPSCRSSRHTCPG